MVLVALYYIGMIHYGTILCAKVYNQRNLLAQGNLLAQWHINTKGDINFLDFFRKKFATLILSAQNSFTVF